MQRRPFGYHDALVQSASSSSSSTGASGGAPSPVELEQTPTITNNETTTTTTTTQQQQLQQSLFENVTSLVEESVFPNVDVGRNLRRIFSTTSEASSEESVVKDSLGMDPLDGHKELLYCHIPTLLRYSTNGNIVADFNGGSVASGDTVGGGNVGAIAYQASAAIMLGFHHANLGLGNVAPALDQLNKRCPIRFTTEILNKGGTGLDAVTALTSMVTRDPTSNSNDDSNNEQQQQPNYPQPCALIGGHVSSATDKLASLAAVFDLPVVSSSAMSTTLNDATQYPTFARTHTDVGGFGTMAVSFLQNNFRVKKFAMLFSNDSYGLGYANSVLIASTRLGMDCINGGIPYQINGNGELIDNENGENDNNEGENDNNDIRTALLAIKKTGCNYIIGSFYSGSLAKIMTIAGELGIAGPGKVWLISGTADIAPFVLGGALQLPKDSLAVQALEGNGMYFCEGGVPGLGGSYDLFTKQWKLLGQNQQAMNYINSKQPIKQKRDDNNGINDDIRYAFPPALFEKRPHHVVTFSYDAAVGLALSACDAWEQQQQQNNNASGISNNINNNDDDVFTGTEHHSVLSNMAYYGASGKIEFRKDFPTRTAESSYFVMVNLRSVDHNDSHVKFMGSPVVNYFNTSASIWEGLGNNNEFVYSDGTTTPPIEMIPNPSHDEQQNNVSTASLIASIVLGVLLLLVGIIFYIHHKRRKADAFWKIKREDLDFGSDPELIGKGSFGVVYVAYYRGTKVAVKQVHSPHNKDIIGNHTHTTKIFKDDDEEKEEKGNMSHSSNLGLLSVSKRMDAIPMSLASASRSSGRPFLEEGNMSISSNLGLLSVSKRMEAIPMASAARSSGLPFLSSSSISMNEFFYNKSSSMSGGAIKKNLKVRRLRSEFVTEIRHLAKLRHPNIATTIGAVLTPGEEPMMIMEYMEHGSLYDAIRNETINLNSKEDILTIVQDIAHGLRFLHLATPAVIHGDLKSKNVLIDSSFRAKIADFGLSTKKKMKKGARGTPYWMSPELLMGNSTNTTMSDIFAFGTLLFEVYSRQNPYEGEDFMEVIRLVCDPSVCKRPPVPSSCPSNIAMLMQRCWEENPENRPTANEVDSILQAEGTIQGRIVRMEALNQELLHQNHQISSEQAKQLAHFASMSHEIRTPLNCVVGISSLLEDDDHLDPSTKESVKMISSSGKLLRQVVDDVLDFSKFVSGNAEIEIERTDLQETLATIISSMALFPATEKNKITIRTIYSTLVPRFVETDGRRLQQIMYNLLSNAIKFSKLNGNVDLSVSVVPRYQKMTNTGGEEKEDVPLLSNSNIRHGLRLQVKDYGQGIDKSEFGKLFEPFQQTESGKKHGKGGTGLGLPIVKQLVELLGGSISADSKVGEWTEFSLQFPLSVPVVDPRAIASKLNGCCIWLVSDKKCEIEYMKSVCEDFKIDLRHFETMKEGPGNSRVNMMGTVESHSMRFETTVSIEQRGGGNSKGKYCICLVQDDLYEDSVFDRVSRRSRIKSILVSFGNSGRIRTSHAHYSSLAQLFPSALIQELTTLCESQRPDNTGPVSSKLETALSQVCYKELKILVAEDNLVNQKVITRMLDRLGVSNVQLADNGQIAVDLEAENSYDVVFMDMQMPELDGVKACKRIMAQPTDRPRPKIVFLSANVMDDCKSLCAETGATDYLMKPCTLVDLRSMLEKLTSIVDDR